MNRFAVTALPLVDLKLIERKCLGDSRGFLSRVFCAEELRPVGWCKPIAQINHTYTTRSGTVRGLHYQRQPHTEMKLVTCVRGEVWDVAVDLRTGSPTFLQWHAEILSVDNHRALLIPEGFAHGFQALTDDVELLYCHSAVHRPEAEAAVNARDPCLAIAWPLEIAELSLRDAKHPLIDSTFVGVCL